MVISAALNYSPDDTDSDDFDGCCHGKGWDEICVECCPEDDDGSWTGDEWGAHGRP